MNGKINITIDDNGVNCETSELDVFQTLFFLDVAKKIVMEEAFTEHPVEESTE